ncbi:nucleotidyltransferase family protein [Paenibacillus sp. VCA1]|uniref:nucleotidyltransferase family protein n=1 Tax=Paenibacillus sp. VCA1 TaxID=3039148 RepID=UPI002871318D|nr:nucleotidyltransferase family protein [Paenibacillus sp. VCA1]MDR9854190.1 nucleotidyltransferase family protein [Paenibacillus sp. VCA1]
MIRSEQDLIRLVQSDDWMMDILHAAKTLQLPDWWVCAGFVRSKIWDVQHGFTERTPLPDVDVVFFDPGNPDEAVEKEHESKLFSIRPNVPWSVKNEARMHLLNRMPPFVSSVDAISNFTETATALGLTLDEHDRIVLTAPHGIQDAIDLIVKPTPYYNTTPERAQIYENRVRNKNWNKIWPNLTIVQINVL